MEFSDSKTEISVYSLNLDIILKGFQKDSEEKVSVFLQLNIYTIFNLISIREYFTEKYVVLSFSKAGT